jgi:hypothetical protein
LEVISFTQLLVVGGLGMAEVKKKRIGKAEVGLVVSIILVVILGVSNVWSYTNVQFQIDSLNTAYHDYVATHSHSNPEYDDLNTAYQNYMAMSSRPFNNVLNLKNWTKHGVIFSASNISVNRIEDFVVLKAHDGYYYAFLAGGESYEFRDIYLIRGKDIYFNSMEIIGKVVSDPKSTWEDVRVRPRSAIYDNENERYLLFYDGKGSEIEYGSGVLYCAKSDFPNGPWIESENNPILVDGKSEGLMVIKRYGTYTGIYYRFEESLEYKICFSNNPLAKFSIIGNVPYKGKSGFTRGVLKIEGGFLISIEAVVDGYWRIGLAFVDGSLRFASIHQNFPIIVPTEPYEGYQVANPSLFESDDVLIMYYNGHPDNVFSNVVMAYIPKF